MLGLDAAPYPGEREPPAPLPSPAPKGSSRRRGRHVWRRRTEAAGPEVGGPQATLVEPRSAGAGGSNDATTEDSLGRSIRCLGSGSGSRRESLFGERNAPICPPPTPPLSLARPSLQPSRIWTGNSKPPRRSRRLLRLAVGGVRRRKEWTRRRRRRPSSQLSLCSRYLFIQFGFVCDIRARAVYAFLLWVEIMEKYILVVKAASVTRVFIDLS